MEIATWIQAGATVALIGVTAWYAWLTHKLSRTADHQLELLRETHLHLRRADLISLASLAKRLLKSLTELPSSKPDSHKLLMGSLWNPEEIQELRSLAAKCGPEFADMSAQAAVDLHWMLERIALVRSEPRGQGFELTKFPWEAYSERAVRADSALTAIATRAAAKAESVE